MGSEMCIRDRLLDRDIWMRFSSRSYCSLPPRSSDHRIFGELELSHYPPAGVRAYAIDLVASGEASTFATMVP